MDGLASLCIVHQSSELCGGGLQKKKVDACICAAIVSPAVRHTDKLELIFIAYEVNFRDFVVGPFLCPIEEHSDVTNLLCYSVNINLFLSLLHYHEKPRFYQIWKEKTKSPSLR